MAIFSFWLAIFSETSTIWCLPFCPTIPISRTIYVPYENAVNLPDVFELDVGSSFGYAENGAEPQPQQIIHGAPLPSSYDNPISSFDAPIYDENSYTASAVSNKFKS